MSQLHVSSEVVPGGTGKQGMLLHTPKSSSLAPYIPQKTPEALKSGTENTPVSLCPHKATSSNPPGLVSPVPSACPLSGRAAHPSPSPGSCTGPPIPWLWGAAGGVPGLAARGALRSGLRARCGGGGAGNRADVSAAGAPRGPTAAQMCGGGGGSRASPPWCQGIRVQKGFGVFCAVSDGQRSGQGW